MKGDFVNDDFMVRQKREVDVMFAGDGADDFGLVWDGYQVDSWFVLGQGLQNAPTLFYSVRIWKAVFLGRLQKPFLSECFDISPLCLLLTIKPNLPESSSDVSMCVAHGRIHGIM